jgi:type VI secretion system protein ImpH
MGAAVGREADALTFLAALEAAPHRYDFYQTLRRLECLYADRPRWGRARRPGDEPIRNGQDPDLSFAPAPLASFERGSGERPPRLQVRLFGLLGPNGPLPIHLTEYARERLRHAGDPTFSRFLDLLQHRFLALFYRAWAQAQPHVSYDRPHEDRFGTYVGSFIGLATSPFRDRDSVPDVAKLFHAGTLVRQPRNAEGLRGILEQFFRVPVHIEEFVGHWMVLGVPERTRLGREEAALGGGAVAGGRIWDRQHKFRIHVGPLTLRQYEEFLPGGPLLGKLVDWVRFAFGFELEWDLCLRLRAGEVPAARLAGRHRLGWTTWLGGRDRRRDAADLCLDAEMAQGAAVRAVPRPPQGVSQE